MRGILFIKTSSLGDVVHQMPAMTDARRHYPEARLTWVVEEAFAPLAKLHPAVDDVIAVSTRRWRSQLLQSSTWREISAFKARMRCGECGEGDRYAGPYSLGVDCADRAR